MTPVPHPPYSSDPTVRDFIFLFPWLKKVLKRKCMADVEKVIQKMAEALKGIKMDEFKTVLNSGNNVLIGVLRQMESIYLEDN